jgi:hypothetical protein
MLVFDQISTSSRLGGTMRLAAPTSYHVLALTVLSGLFASYSASGTIITKSFTGTLSCFVNCAPPSAETGFLAGQTFTGTYSYNDAVIPTSGDPSTFRE